MARSNVRSRDDVVGVIVALLVSEKPAYNIPVAKLDNNYRTEEGERIPYKELGYPTLIDFLRTIPSIHLHHRDGMNCINFLGTDKTRHVSELVAKQKASTKSQRHRSTCRRSIPSNYYSRVCRNATSLTRINDSSMASLILDLIQNEPRGIAKSFIVHRIREKKPNVYFDVHGLNEILETFGNKVMIRDNMIYPARNLDGQRSSDVPWSVSKEFNDESKKIKKPINNFALDRDDCDDLADYDEFDYVSSVPKKDNTVEFIQRSLDEEREKINDAGKNGDCNGEVVNGDVNGEKNAVELIVSDRMRFRLEKLIQNRPKGIWCAELPKIFTEEYKIPLEWEELGFNSLSDLVLNLPEIFRCIQPNPAGDFQLFHAKSDAVNSSNQSRPTLASVYKIYKDPEDDVPAVPATIPSHMINNLIPDDVVPMGESIGQISITCFNQDDKGYEEVVICDAFSPSFFWIQLRRKQLKLSEMMDTVQTFYEKHDTKYSVPLIVLEKGLNVACQFYGKWHRGIVKAVEPDQDSTTTILYYDYGTLHKHPASEVRFLHRLFSQLPAQAIPCGLFNIKPPDYNIIKTPDGRVKSVWPIQTSRTFVQRVHDKPLVAMCGKMHHENNSLLISLTDTSSEEDVNIGDWLVDNGLAIHGTMDLIVDPSDLSLYEESYEWESNPEVEPNSINPPPGFSSHSDDNIQLIQNLLNQLKESKTYETRLFYRNIQLSSLLNAVDDLINGIIDPSMLDADVLSTIKRDIEQDQKTIFSNYSAIDDCYCRVIRASENGNGQSQNSTGIKEIGESNGIDTNRISSESSDDLNFLLVSSSTRKAADKKNTDTCNDESESYHSDSPTIQLDESESLWSVGQLSDTNPFKYDFYSSSWSLESPRIPPPIPPRTRGLAVKKIEREVNNNETRGNESCRNLFVNGDTAGFGSVVNIMVDNQKGSHWDARVSDNLRMSHTAEYKPELPPRNSKNIANQLNSVTIAGKQLERSADCLKIELSKCTMFVFFIDNQGWITIDQFRTGLTNFTDSLSITKFLREHKHQARFRVIGKQEEPRLFDLIDMKTRECSMNIRRDEFYLIPVDGILLKMLKALKVVPLEDIRHLKNNKGVSNNPVLKDCSTLLLTYLKSRESVDH